MTLSKLIRLTHWRAGVLFAGLCLAGGFEARGQVSPCTTTQLQSTTVTSGTSTQYGPSDLSAGGSNYYYINTDGSGNPTGNATVIFESANRICLGPGFQAAAASGGSFTALIGTLSPAITGLSPNSGAAGTAVYVTISGVSTSFTNGSAVSLGAGITVSNVAATSSTTLTATLQIAAGATAGARSLTVDSLTLPNAFTVTSGTAVPASVSYTYDSQGRLASTAYATSSGTVTAAYSYDAAGNRTAVVTQ